jgi:hypothetical protein
MHHTLGFKMAGVSSLPGSIANPDTSFPGDYKPFRRNRTLRGLAGSFRFDKLIDEKNLILQEKKSA